jgi:hypothetical protein
MTHWIWFANSPTEPVTKLPRGETSFRVHWNNCGRQNLIPLNAFGACSPHARVGWH